MASGARASGTQRSVSFVSPCVLVTVSDSDRATSGLYHWEPLSAEGASVGLKGRQIDVEQRHERHAEIDLASGAIDHRRGADDVSARRARDLHRLARRTAGREHV